MERINSDSHLLVTIHGGHSNYPLDPNGQRRDDGSRPLLETIKSAHQKGVLPAVTPHNFFPYGELMGHVEREEIGLHDFLPGVEWGFVGSSQSADGVREAIVANLEDETRTLFVALGAGPEQFTGSSQSRAQIDLIPIEKISMAKEMIRQIVEDKLEAKGEVLREWLL